MPTYEYACAKCEERFDVYQSFSDEPLKKHQACGGKLTKVFGPVGIVLKGSGFYKTDNRSSPVKAAKKDSDSATSESGASGASSEAGSSPSENGSKSGSSTSTSSSSSDGKKKSDTPKKTEAPSPAKSKSA